MEQLSIQERYVPDGECFGCGPKNQFGLRIRSFPSPDGAGVFATWQPMPHHAAGPGVLNGGIVGTLLDCHSAAALLLVTEGVHEDGAWFATVEFTVALRRPTLPDAPLQLFARIVEFDGSDARTEAHLESEGKLRATCSVHFRRFTPR